MLLGVTLAYAVILPTSHSTTQPSLAASTARGHFSSVKYSPALQLRVCACPQGFELRTVNFTSPPLNIVFDVSCTQGGAGPQMVLTSLGSAYAASLAARPIITKSMTSAAIFGLSDVAAQKIGGSFDDAKRTLTSILVGLFYFGPALHYWLQMITAVIPGFGPRDTLFKTLLGQSIFGPTITCVFFAATLIANSGLAAGLKQLPQKVRQDLFVTWSSGLCYWPFVDLVCYSIVPVKWIPLGYNVASFFCNSRCRPSGLEQASSIAFLCVHLCVRPCCPSSFSCITVRSHRSGTAGTIFLSIQAARSVGA